MAFEIRDYNYTLHDFGGHEIILQLSDVDESGEPKYAGYLGSGGVWMIIMESASGAAIRYAFGKTAYSTAWNDRATQTYALYSNAI